MILKSKLKIAGSLLPAYLLGVCIYAEVACHKTFTSELGSMSYTVPYWDCFFEGIIYTIVLALIVAVVFGAAYLPYRVINSLRASKILDTDLATKQAIGESVRECMRLDALEASK